jgi:hypothetical protein
MWSCLSNKAARGLRIILRRWYHRLAGLSCVEVVWRTLGNIEAFVAGNRFRRACNLGVTPKRFEKCRV